MGNIRSLLKQRNAPIANFLKEKTDSKEKRSTDIEKRKTAWCSFHIKVQVYLQQKSVSRKKEQLVS